MTDHAATYTATFTDDAGTLTMLADALEQAADQRRRAVLIAGAELEAERRGGKDVRTGAVRLVKVLAEASTCDRYARGLRAALADGPAPAPPAEATPMEEGTTGPTPAPEQLPGVIPGYSPLVVAAQAGLDLDNLDDDGDEADELEDADAQVIVG